MKNRNTTPTRILQFALLLLLLASPFVVPGLRYKKMQLGELSHFGCLFTSGVATLDCIEKSYVTLTDTKGATVAMSSLRSDFAQYPTVAQTCHQFAHAIGRTAAKNNTSLPELFTKGDAFCWSGYYHGAVEGLLRGTKISAMDEARVSTFCNSVAPPAYPYFDYFNCVHGVGHALMYVSNNDLPESLVRCNYFAEDNDHANCAAGTFMENLLSSQNGHHTSYIAPNNPFFPCVTIADVRIRRMCYETQATQVTFESGLGVEAFAICSGVTDTHDRAYCYHGLGREISSQLQYNNTLVRDACLLAPDATPPCVIGAAKNYVAYYHRANEALMLCGEAAGEVAQACVDAVHALVSLQTKTGE